MTQNIGSESSIIIMGNMSPSVHHPQWYGIGGILTDGDVQMARENAMVTPQAARFSTASLQVQCVPTQWSAHASGEGASAIVLDVAKATFEILRGTPMSAFGLNVSLASKCSEHLGSRIGESLQKGLELPDFDAAQLDQFCLTREMPQLACASMRLDRIFRVYVSVKAEPDPTLRVSINVHHEIDADGVSEFDFSEMLETAAPVYGSATRYADLVLRHFRGDCD